MATARKRQGLLAFEYQPEPDGDEVTAWAGLPLIAETMRRIGLEKPAAALAIRERARGFSELEMIVAHTLLVSSGGECLDDLEHLRHDQALTKLLGHALPSPDAMRRFLEAFHDEDVLAERPALEAHRAHIPPESAALARLADVLTFVVGAIANNEPEPLTRATIDHDATVIEAHKKDARPHYKGGRGYQPAIAVWAERMLVVADEFRDGNVPAAMANLPLIERAFAALPTTVVERYFRADSACYDEKVLKWLADPARGIGFAISADMSRELHAACVAVEDGGWTVHETRSDVVIHRAEVEFTSGDWPKDAKPLRYLALRYTKMQGQLFAGGTATRYFAIVTNREGDAGELIDWHREKAGTVEQVHAMTKNELGAGVLPSGKFGANAAWYRLVLIAHAVQILMKRRVLSPDLRDAHPKRLRFRVFTLAAKVLVHSRRVIARVSARLLEWADAVAARVRILSLAPG